MSTLEICPPGLRVLQVLPGDLLLSSHARYVTDELSKYSCEGVSGIIIRRGDEGYTYESRMLGFSSSYLVQVVYWCTGTSMSDM